jgi:hypothetical protein
LPQGRRDSSHRPGGVTPLPAPEGAPEALRKARTYAQAPVFKVRIPQARGLGDRARSGASGLRLVARSTFAFGSSRAPDRRSARDAPQLLSGAWRTFFRLVSASSAGSWPFDGSSRASGGLYALPRGRTVPLDGISRKCARGIDERAVKELGIPSMVLMENAGAGAARVVSGLWTSAYGCVVCVCGPGNNGGASE